MEKKQNVLLRKISTMLHTRRIFMKKLAGTWLFRLLPDKTALKILYKNVFSETLDLKAPQTFNQKLQWLKLYNRKPEYTRMVDKYEAKKYVADIIGGEYIIPTYGVWNSFDEIDFSKLPDRFVLKCTHGSGDVVICKDKARFDYAAAKKKLTRSLHVNYYKIGREWPYKNVKPRIIAEEYMVDSSTRELRDYKFFCFGGQVKCYKIDFDRTTEHHANYFDKSGNLIRAGETGCPPIFDKELQLPQSMPKMQCLAEKLSRCASFLRVDFYDVDGNIYFGELTFFPASGFGSFEPKEFDAKLGEWLVLPRAGANNG